MNQDAYIAFICLSILLALIYVGIIYWKFKPMFGIELSMHDLLMYLGTPAVILTLLITLYATYRPMKHYPPLFIMMLYALLGVLYTCVIGYVGYRKVLSMSSCILLCILFVVVVISIFVYTPSKYDSNIDEVQEKFLRDKIYQSDELEKLRQELMISFSDKNKYYIQWFIALLYVPLVVHWRYKCELNPVAYTFIYNYIMNALNLKQDKMENSLIHQSNDLLETLKELDKAVTYTSTEKQLIDKIRESIVNKEKIQFNPEERAVLRKLRKHLERNDAFNYNKSSITSLYQATTNLINGNKASVQEHGLYLINLLVLFSVMIYVFVYENTIKLLIIPLFTAFLSLSIFYLKG